MKFTSVIILFLVCSNINLASGQNIDQIYLEYQQTFYKAYKSTNHNGSVLKQFWSIGDTVELKYDSYLIWEWDSAMIYMSSMVDVPQGSKLQIIGCIDDCNLVMLRYKRKVGICRILF